MTNWLDAVTRQLVTHPIVVLISAPSVVTTHHVVLNPIVVPLGIPTSVPLCVINFCPNFVTIRHLVLDPISLPNSVIPTFVTIAHLVLNPILNFVIIHHPFSETYFQSCDHSSSRSHTNSQPYCSNRRTDFCPRHFVHFAVRKH